MRTMDKNTVWLHENYLNQNKIVVSNSYLCFVGVNEEGKIMLFWIGSNYFEELNEALVLAENLQAGETHEILLIKKNLD